MMETDGKLMETWIALDSWKLMEPRVDDFPAESPGCVATWLGPSLRPRGMDFCQAKEFVRSLMKVNPIERIDINQAGSRAVTLDDGDRDCDTNTLYIITYNATKYR